MTNSPDGCSAESVRETLAELYIFMDTLEAMRGDKDVLRISGKVGDRQDVGVANAWGVLLTIQGAVKHLETMRDPAQAVGEPAGYQFRQRSGVGKGPQSSAPWCDWCAIDRETYEKYQREPNKLVQVRPVYASQPSPAATVEPACSECHGTGRTDNHVTGEIECTACEGSGEPHECSSAGNGDAGCGAAVITPWADQYNACWDRSKPDALKLAALKALNYIENTEDELGMKLSCGDALREALK